MVVLDTDHMSLLERSGAQGSATLRARLATLQPAEVVTTIISYEEQVRGWMAELLEVSGCNYVICAFAWGTFPYEQTLRSLRLFAEEVMPAFAGSATPLA